MAVKTDKCIDSHDDNDGDDFVDSCGGGGGGGNEGDGCGYGGGGGGQSVITRIQSKDDGPRREISETNFEALSAVQICANYPDESV